MPIKSIKKHIKKSELSFKIIRSQLQAKIKKNLFKKKKNIKATPFNGLSITPQATHLPYYRK